MGSYETTTSPCSPSPAPPPIQSRHTYANCFASIHGYLFSDPSEFDTNIVVQVLVSHNCQLYLHSQEEGTMFPVEDITTLHHCYVFHFPVEVPALPCLLTDFVSNALQSLYLLEAVRADLRPKIESLAIEALEVYGMQRFVLVTQVDLTDIQIVDQETGLAWLHR